MKKIKLLTFTVLLTFLFSFQFSAKEKPILSEFKKQEITNKKHPLEGVWKLQKAKWGDMEDFREETRTIIKIYSQGHFFFIYNKDGAFDGAGGGTYTVSDDSFTETISYFSWDSTAVGTAQSYSYEIKDGVLHQFGTLNSEEYQNYTIDEYYKKVDEATTSNALTGIWEATTMTYGTETLTPASSKLRLIKAFTPTHFHTVTYDLSTGAFDHATFGTYDLKKDQLSETIHVTSRDKAAAGQIFDFTLNIDKNAFTQKGTVNTPKYPNLKITETYKRLK